MSAIEKVNVSPRQALSKDYAEEFLYHEAMLLDARRFEEWEALFTDDGYYWVPMRVEQDNPLTEVSIFYDDKRMIRTRIERLRHPRIHVQDPPSRTCHLVTNVRVEKLDSNDSAVVHSNILVHEYRLGEQRTFAGQSIHALKQINGVWRISRKRVDLINSESVFNAIAIII